MLFWLAALASSFAPQAAAPAPLQRPWTFLVYGAADNSADGPMQSFLDAVRKAIDDDSGIELLVFVDRSDKFDATGMLFGEDFTGARLYRVHKDSVERLGGGEFLPTITTSGDVELDSADADTLKRFIDWGKATAPARKFGLMIYSHASGELMCPDDDAVRCMGIAEVSAELGAKESLDFLALELCNMGGIEVSYQWRPGKDRFGADVMVAIPNAGPPLDWDRAFARVRSPKHESASKKPWLDPSTMSAAQFGELVIEEGREGRIGAQKKGEQNDQEAAACYDLRAVEPVKETLDELATLLWRARMRERVLDLRGPGSGPTLMNYSEGGPYVDLYALCHALENDELVRKDAPDVAAAAKGVCASVDRFVLASFGMSALKGFESGKHGLFVVLPANSPGCWKEFRWYTPLEGDGKSYGHWAFLADGAKANDGVVDNWFELLDAWYDDADEQGGINGYRF